MEETIKMLTVLDRYIGKTVLKSILLVLFMLVGLSAIIKFIEQLRRVNSEYDVFSAGLYTLLTLPKDLETFFPMAALLGGLIGLGLLASRSELVVMEAAGFTRTRIALSVMKTAIPLVILTMVIGEWVSPIGEQTARNLRAQKLYGNAFLSTQTGIWLRDGENFVYIAKANVDGTLTGINIYQVTDKNRLEKMIYASTGTYDTGQNQWYLKNIEEFDFKDDKQIVESKILNSHWQTLITPDKLGMVTIVPDSLSIRELSSYIGYLKSTKQDAKNYQLRFWEKIFKPFSVAVMMLMALSFIFGPLRSVSMGIKVITGVSFGFAFYLCDRIFGPFSIVYNIPTVIAALLPSILFLLISLYLLNRRA